MSPFKLQYGVEPRLPRAEARGSATRLEKAVTINDRQRIRNLRKYRTVAAERYNAAMQRLADARNDTTFLTDPLQPGDLVMRSPINLSRGSQARAVATQDSHGIELLQAKENLHAV